MKKRIIDNIVNRIDHLEGLYSNHANDGDFKALQGMERCIELLMRLHGIDGKTLLNEFAEEIIDDNSMINLRDLSSDTLNELITIAERCDVSDKVIKKTVRIRTRQDKTNTID